MKYYLPRRQLKRDISPHIAEATLAHDENYTKGQHSHKSVVEFIYNQNLLWI